MPKRKSSSSLSSIVKRLKVLEEELKVHNGNTCRRPRRPRIIESSSPSTSISRDSTPTPENLQDGYDSEPREYDDPVMAEQEVGVTDEARPSSSKTVQICEPEIQESQILTEEDDLVAILGTDPTATNEYGSEIHKELATRYNHIATKGLTKDSRKELCDKYEYLTPSNCTLIGAPKLNAEIKAALNETLIKRDKAIEARQKQLASAISCLAMVITEQFAVKDTNHEILKKVMDAGRLLCDLQYSESITRRNFALFSLKKDMKEHLLNTTVDKYLFGEGLPDALKTAKAVTKSSIDLKTEVRPMTKTRPITSQKPQTAKNLNWRSPAPIRRQLGASRSQEPASQRNRHGKSSKPSSYHQKSTRRR